MGSGSENIDRLKSIVDYIEIHIKDDILLEDISKKASLSKYYVDRIFKFLTDKSLMDYVRGRRLIRSVELLFSSDLSVLDIALEYNFQHEQSYIRSFKKLFHISHGIYSSYRSGMLFRPRFVIKPGFFVTGLKYLVNDIDNNE